MYFRISDNFALRSWSDVEYACYKKGHCYALPLTLKQAKVLELSDGEHDIEADDTVMGLLMRKMIESCEKGEHPSDWSAYKKYDNKYFPKMNIMITGKCNYNCLHCFNAADNAPIMSEWTYEELCDLFDQAAACGIHALTITGGEPMMHKRFLDILREIHKRGMFVEELNTNGFYINQEILDEMKKIGCFPLIKISFDGVGVHDWMRNRKNSEELTLDAMRLCIKNGFRVKAQTQVNKKNVDVMMPTVRILSDMGVETTRLIRTTEVPRWAKNAPDSCLSFDEYYSEMLDFAVQYQKSGMEMDIDIWQMLRLYPKNKSFMIAPVMYPKGSYRESACACKGNRGMIAVTSSGEVVPCMQMSGLLSELGISFGNLHKTALHEIINSGAYLDNICMTVGDVYTNNEKCKNCNYFYECTGGCRAMGLLYSGQRIDYYGEDASKCHFFENGWLEKVSDALSDWENLSVKD